ncbi:hypothetical protein EJB05_37387, partial [Eragrostis curvula]
MVEASGSITTVDNTSLDESKIYLIFCIPGTCDYFDGEDKDCYCCKDFSRKENCHMTMEECRAKCNYNYSQGAMQTRAVLNKDT